MAEPENFMLVLLREMRTEMNRRFDEMNDQFGQLRQEVRENTRRIDSVKQAAFGESVIGRYMVAEVEERLEKIEKRLEALEGRE